MGRSDRMLTCAVAAAVLLAGCGDDGDADERGTQPPEAVVERYYASVQDPRARCSTLSAESLKRYGSFENCVKRTIPPKEKPAPIKVHEVKTAGERGCVRFTSPSGGMGIAMVVREAETWRVDGFDSGIEPVNPGATPCRGSAARERD